MTAPIAALQLASRAYGASSTASPAALASSSNGGSGFGALVSNFASQQINTLRASERTTALAVAGKVDQQSMVEAAMNAQSTVQTVVSVLGKATSAYNDVMHMSV